MQSSGMVTITGVSVRTLYSLCLLFHLILLLEPVARFVSEDATASQCQSRYSRLDTTLKRGKWSKEEDSRLELAFKAYGNSWVEVAACIPGRTNGQCREHWSELSCSRAQWTEEEEKSLKDAVSTMGNSWTKIAEQLGHGRTGQQVRLLRNPEIYF
jgi:hypothetical protein